MMTTDNSSSSRFIDITFHKIYTYTDMGEEFSSKTLFRNIYIYTVYVFKPWGTITNIQL